MDDEIQIFKDYFKQHFKTNEIFKSDFIKLLEQKFQIFHINLMLSIQLYSLYSILIKIILKKFERKADIDHAKKALSLLKEKLDLMKRSASHVLAPFDAEGTGNLNELENGDLYIKHTRNINLAKFLDKQDDGYISINDLDVALRQAHLPISSTGSFGLTDKKYIEKWKTQK